MREWGLTAMILAAATAGCAADGLQQLPEPGRCINYGNCQSFLTDQPCPAVPAEVCDGKDNNCDGTIDEWDSNTGEACVYTCYEFSGCSSYESNTLCPEGPGEVCDGVDNDCDGEVDEDDPMLGAGCNQGDACDEGVLACVGGALQCQAFVGTTDIDGDGIHNDVDPDDDNDGLPDIDDEFPDAIVLDELLIDFDFEPSGFALGANAVLRDQYASWGVTFGGDYVVTRRASAYLCYNGTTTLNLLCTETGSSGSNCAPPSSPELSATLSEPWSYASMEMRTRCDAGDGDQGRVTAYDGSGAELASTTQVGSTSGSPFNEGLAVIGVRADDIRSVRFRPNDFDSMDNMRLVRLVRPCELL